MSDYVDRTQLKTVLSTQTMCDYVHLAFISFISLYMRKPVRLLLSHLQIVIYDTFECHICLQLNAYEMIQFDCMCISWPLFIIYFHNIKNILFIFYLLLLLFLIFISDILLFVTFIEIIIAVISKMYLFFIFCFFEKIISLNQFSSLAVLLLKNENRNQYI